jgi:hypothetical protein
MHIPRRRPEGRISLITFKTSLRESQGPTLPHLYTYSGDFGESVLTEPVSTESVLTRISVFKSFLMTACLIPIHVYLNIDIYAYIYD